MRPRSRYSKPLIHRNQELLNQTPECRQLSQQAAHHNDGQRTQLAVGKQLLPARLRGRPHRGEENPAASMRWRPKDRELAHCHVRDNVEGKETPELIRRSSVCLRDSVRRRRRTGFESEKAPP